MKVSKSKKGFAIFHKNNSMGENLFDIGNALFLIVFCISTLYPFVYLLSVSFASKNVPQSVLYLIPPEISLENYRRVLVNPHISSGYVVTFTRTILGTLLSLFCTTTMAYVLSKKYFPHRNFWTALVIVTMFFDGGLIPNYLLIKNLGLMDNVLSLILPNLVSAFNLVIVRNYFMSLPDALEESARIDGANDFVIFARIILPLSKPIIATVSLWIAVWHWNAWFDSMLYSIKGSIDVVQLVMRRIVIEGSSQYVDMANSSLDAQYAVTPEGLKAATVMVTTIPILIVYPFIQKYFVKGVMVGSLKG